MITELTPHQQSQIKVYYDKYLALGTSTSRMDKSKVKTIIDQIYADFYKKNSNPFIIYCKSPYQANILINIFSRTDFLKKIKNLQIPDSFGKSLDDSLGDSLSDSLSDSLRTSLRTSLWDSLWDSLRASMQDSLRTSLRTSLWDSLWDSLRASMQDSLRASMQDSLGNSLGASLRDSLRVSLSTSLATSLEESITSLNKLDYISTYFWGQFDFYWIAFYKYCEEILGINYEQVNLKKLNLLESLGKECSFIYFYENYVFVCEKPTEIHATNNYKSLHNEDGAAMKFEDGYSIYSVNGRRIPSYIIENPENITIQKINEEHNAEVRVIMRKKYGYQRYLNETEAQIVDQDLDKMGRPRILYRIEKEEFLLDNEPIQTIHVKNSTPEPDGSYKDYFLGIPPDIKKCHDAIAWTFDLTPEEYDPSFES